MFEWNPIYSIGVEQYDEQHKRLFAIAQKLYEAMSTGQAAPFSMTFSMNWWTTPAPILPPKKRLWSDTATLITQSTVSNMKN